MEQAEDKILELKGNGIKNEVGTALCRPLSEKHFVSLWKATGRKDLFSLHG